MCGNATIRPSGFGPSLRPTPRTFMNRICPLEPNPFRVNNFVSGFLSGPCCERMLWSPERKMTAAPSPMMPESQAPGMSRVVAVQDQFGAWLMPGRKSPPSKEGGYSDRADAAIERGVRLCAELEAGNILFCDREAINLCFPRTAFPISAEEREFLLGQKQTSAAYHKNIAYRPGEDRVTGLDKSEAAEAERLRKLLRDNSQSAPELLEKLPPRRAAIPPRNGSARWRIVLPGFCRDSRPSSGARPTTSSCTAATTRRRKTPRFMPSVRSSAGNFRRMRRGLFLRTA